MTPRSPTEGDVARVSTRGVNGFRVTLFEALKGASGPREGQKSTFCSTQSEFCELTFCPLQADLGISRGSSSCRYDSYHPIQILST